MQTQLEMNTIIDALKECSERKAVYELFKKHNIDNASKRLELLKEVMGNPESFYSQIPTEEDQVDRQISILLTGVWRINEYYERAGL